MQEPQIDQPQEYVIPVTQVIQKPERGVNKLQIGLMVTCVALIIIIAIILAPAVMNSLNGNTITTPTMTPTKITTNTPGPSEISDQSVTAAPQISTTSQPTKSLQGFTETLKGAVVVDGKTKDMVVTGSLVNSGIKHSLFQDGEMEVVMVTGSEFELEIYAVPDKYQPSNYDFFVPIDGKIANLGRLPADSYWHYVDDKSDVKCIDNVQTGQYQMNVEAPCGYSQISKNGLGNFTAMCMGTVTQCDEMMKTIDITVK
jgi:hypothetical protein